MVVPVYEEDGRLPPGFRPWVMWGLVAANVLVFIFLAINPAMVVVVLAYHFGTVPAFLTGATSAEEFNLLVPSWVTLATYTFVHPAWFHLAANMIFLWVFGDNVEAATGHLRFLALYVMSGVAGGLAHVVSDTHSEIPLIGASGAVAGIVGAYLLIRPCAAVTVLLLGVITVKLRAYWMLGIWIAWQIIHVTLLRSGDEIAYWSHLGGFVAGLLLMPALRRRGVKLLPGLRCPMALRRTIAHVRRRLG